MTAQCNITEINGWLSLDGTFYKCSPWNHGRLAESICSQKEIHFVCAELTLESLGWVRLKRGLPHQGSKRHPTDSQKKFVMDYFLSNISEFSDVERLFFKHYSDDVR